MLAAWSGQLQTLLLLLHMGMDTSLTSEQGWYALMYAARAGQATTLQCLLEWGANPNVHESINGVTPLMFAAFAGSIECVNILLENGADPLAKAFGGALAFAFAEQNGHLGIAGLLRHRAMEAQAEEQAVKEQKEALLARQKAKKDQALRKKEEIASAKRLAEISKQQMQQMDSYKQSYMGQLEILSVSTVALIKNLS